MDEGLSILFVMVEVGGIWAPIVFIFFHIFRQFLFIPVSLVCMAGGILFGSVFGTIFSLFGLILSSILFYFVIGKLPKTHEKLSRLRKKMVWRISSCNGYAIGYFTVNSIHTFSFTQFLPS